MAHIEMVAFNTLFRRFQTARGVEDDLEAEQHSFDENIVQGYEMIEEGNIQKYKRVDQNNIDYLDSEHTLAIQSSAYVKVENNRERILRQQIQKKDLIKPKYKGKDGCNINNQHLNLRFCNE